jgi:thiamine pyridinylase
MMNRLFILSALLLFSSSIAAKRELKVTLYPYIPTGNLTDNFTPLSNKLEKEFEEKHPEIDLKLTIDMAVDPYELADWKLSKKKKKLLLEGGSDIVEIDALYLKSLAASGLIHEVNFSKDDYFKAAIDSVTVDGKTFGVPSWMCGYFQFSSDEKVANSSNISELIKTNKMRFPKNSKIAGKFEGTYSMALLYLDSYLDSNPNKSPIKASQNSAAPEIMENIYQLFSACIENDGKKFECGKKTYAKNLKLGDVFQNKEAQTFVGYGELLHSLKLMNKNNKVYFKSLSIGSGSKHLALTDALVINKKKCNGKCYEDAKSFINFYSSPETLGWITLNKDNPGKPPRYLSPSRKSFYKGQEDKAYKVFYDSIISGVAAPNEELVSNRRRLKTEMINYLIKKNKIFDIYNKNNSSSKKSLPRRNN